MSDEISQASAKSLAIRYSAFHAARSAGNDRGVAFWGDLLLESIEVTGVDFGADHIRALVRSTRAIAERRQADEQAA